LFGQREGAAAAVAEEVRVETRGKARRRRNDVDIVRDVEKVAGSRATRVEW
jgi:hypothetical protein